MTNRKNLRGIPGVMAVLMLLGAACGGAENQWVVIDDQNAVEEGKADQPVRLCPAIAILCARGYRPKRAANCRQLCVPAQAADGRANECRTDADCQINCITTPCDVGVCRGGSCQVASAESPATGSELCGSRRCPAGSYCCNASCGTCAPEGYFCTMIACSTDLTVATTLQ